MKYRMKRILNWFREYRTQVAVAAAICVFFGVPMLINNSAVVGAAATARELPIYSVARDNKCVSLTFDAAWLIRSMTAFEAAASKTTGHYVLCG